VYRGGLKKSVSIVILAGQELAGADQCLVVVSICLEQNILEESATVR